APIYLPSLWMGIYPPPPTYTCGCNQQGQPYPTYATTAQVSEKYKRLIEPPTDFSLPKSIYDAVMDSPELRKAIAAGCKMEVEMSKNDDGSYTLKIRTKNKVAIVDDR